MQKMTWSELQEKFRKFNEEHNWAKEHIAGYIVFTEDSFDKEYSLESRTYEVWSDCKAFVHGMGGYSIYGTSLDLSDVCVRLDQYMANVHGGKNGWKVDYCYMLD